MASGDFNNNGRIDLATTADSPDRVLTWHNDGSRGFVPGPTYVLQASSSPQDLIAGDFNADGCVDLAVAVRDPSGRVLILNNNGNGTFILGATVLVGVRPRGLSIGDINNNGFLDIAVANRDGNTASVLFNAGGTFSTVTTVAVGQEPRATVLADFEDDGFLNLAVTNHDDRTISVFRYVGGTSFTLWALHSTGAQVRPEGVTAGDFDLDGMIDLAAAVSGQNPPVNQAMIWWAGLTGPSAYNTGGTNTGRITAADFDCDGLLDLATTNQDSNNLSVLRSLGGGAFAAPVIYSAATRPGAIIAAEFTDNGPSIAVANRDPDNITVHLNVSAGCEPVKCAPPDLNCDGVVDVLDLLILLDAWGACKNCKDCEADFNGDCLVDVLDLLFLLDNWG